MKLNNFLTKKKGPERGYPRRAFGILATLLLKWFEVSCRRILLALVPNEQLAVHDDINAGDRCLCRDDCTAKIEFSVSVAHARRLQSSREHNHLIGATLGN